MSVDTSALGANLTIRNTVLNRNTLTPVLFSICTNNNSPIVLESGDVHALNATDVYQALCMPGGQPVNLQACNGTATISLGEDTATNALNWLEHLDLLAEGKRIQLRFYISGGRAGTGCTVNIANSSIAATFNHVITQVNGAADNNDSVLFAATEIPCAGTIASVEVICLSLTPGSEQVGFNVLRGYGC